MGSRDRLRAAVDGVAEMMPPAGTDPDGQWRASVVERFATVRPFLRMLCEVLEFGAHDVIRVLQHDGRLTDLGEAIAYSGRIFKTLHVLTFADDPGYRRHLKGMRDLQEQRHGLSRHVFHGRKGELYQAYHAGMEDQLGALGLVLNCITLWNTRYLDHALDALRTQEYPVLEADAARLSAYQHKHITVHGHYSFALPDLGDGRRPLRDPDVVEE